MLTAFSLRSSRATIEGANSVPKRRAMQASNAVLRLSEKIQALFCQLPFASRFHQVGTDKSVHNGNQWRLQPQQLRLAILALTAIALGRETVQAQNSPAMGVSPKSFAFAAVQEGANPGDQTLDIAGANLNWTASGTTPWLALTPSSGTTSGPVTITVTTGSLKTGTYTDVITVSAGGSQSVTVPVTFYVAPKEGVGPPAPAIIPHSANATWEAVCVDRSLNLLGDFQGSIFGYGEGSWSVGPSVSTQLIKFDLAKERAGFNTAVGVGASFRYYNKIQIKDSNGQQKGNAVTISQVKQECRQTTFKARSEKSYLAAPMFSITPTLYVTKPTNQGDLEAQPAILLGFFEDILNFGVGWNLTGPPGEKGNVFLLMSIGAGFNF